MNRTVRNIRKEDLPALKEVLNTIELFPATMLDEMIKDYLVNENSMYIWLTTIENGNPISIAYCAPEMLTEGTCNMLAIGVHSAYQGQGIGGELIIHLEELLRKMGHRILIVETSSDTNFKATRRFYLNKGYTKEAVIRDFWREGEDKVIFWKKL